MAQPSASSNRPVVSDDHLIGEGKLVSIVNSKKDLNLTNEQIDEYIKFIKQPLIDDGKNSTQVDSVIGVISFLRKTNFGTRKSRYFAKFEEYINFVVNLMNFFKIRNEPIFTNLKILKSITRTVSKISRAYIDKYVEKLKENPDKLKTKININQTNNVNDRYKKIEYRLLVSKYYNTLEKLNADIKKNLDSHKTNKEIYGDLKKTLEEVVITRNDRMMEFIVEQLRKFYDTNRKKQTLDFKELKLSNSLKQKLMITNRGKKAENLKSLVNRYKPSLMLNKNSFLRMISKNAQEYKNSIYITANYSESQLKNTNKKIEGYVDQAFRGIVDSDIRKLKELKGAKRKEESEKLKQFLDKVQTLSSKTFSINYGLNKIQSELMSGNKKNENNISQSYFNVYKNRLNKNIPVNLNSNEVKSKFKNRKDLYEKLKTLSIVSKKGEGKKELNIANKIVKNEINYFKKYGKFKNNAQYIKQYNISPEYLKKIKEENMQNLNSNLQEIKVKYVKGLVNAREKYLEDVVKEYLSYLRNPRKEGGIKLKNIDKNYKNTVSEINKDYGSGFIKKFKPLVSKYLREEEERTRRKIRILRSRIRSRLLRERSKRRTRKPKTPQKK